MSSIFATSNSDNYFSTYFGTSSSSSSSSSTNSLFTSLSSSLGDYSLIKSGSYKKLLNAYYSTTSSSSDDDEEDSTTSLVNVKTNAYSIKDALDALSDSSLYKSTGTDEDGNTTYDTDKIKKALQSYVDSYNSYMESANEVSNTSILSKTLSMVNNTDANASLLSQVGITVGTDNQLEFDETALDSIDSTTISALTTLFSSGSHSYGDTISQKATAAYKLANSAAYTNTHASSYTYNGAYSILGTSSSTSSVDTYL